MLAGATPAGKNQTQLKKQRLKIKVESIVSASGVHLSNTFY
jgi:hypothetical protein